MTTRATNIVSKLLANSTNLELVKELVAEDATYISLNYNKPELRGTIEKFDVHASFGGSNTADFSDRTEHVAIFGCFVYRSKSIGKLTDPPFAVWAKVDTAEGKVTYMQFIEGTLSSANGFRSRVGLSIRVTRRVGRSS
ncbi:hypothetical protein LTR35_012490 [Friedmanniomyces endolithicus]|uniref:SnoaL-like domain-containing protein n=1 Tax=Friedmanniomyces endolithicus TaxID=329885 RepID=A0AAN6JDC5_9PEZI|nr:hypothetical protein LTR35_012490 [Friedmanniomyces endolithicus]KAK0294642.1 hypothetical protein LTS00_006843 [Friedmanniomyces endolithicus]KAK0325975.1 hypothetical protein LTR82_002720 [Friedmanniomyces endolithicus]KAK1009751.1 hypothetical protein LTR54_005547 [Friedmanniomyces endolithicus]